MYKLTGLEIRALFLENKISAQEILSYFLQRIEKFDSKIGAFIHLCPERALAQAKLLDKKREQGAYTGKLAGIPIAVKDNIHLKGEKTTCASKFLRNYRAVFDATVTTLLENEGAILIGKTNMDEFAMGSSTENSALKETSNPWKLNCVPGGSSGGSAAAVAARLTPLALGTDTGGSVRQPAAFCGIFGLKPTYGRISRYGLVAYGSSLDQIGPMATSVADLAAIMEVLSVHDPNDATSLPSETTSYPARLQEPIAGMTIGIPWHLLGELGKEAQGNFHLAIEQLKSLDVGTVEIDLDILKHAIATYYIIATAEAATNLARFDAIRYGERSKEPSLYQMIETSRAEGFGPEVKKRIMLGTFVLSSGLQDAFYKKAAKVRIRIIQEFLKAFEKCDCIAMPVSPVAAFPKGAIRDPLEGYLQDIYTTGVNLAHLCGISIPTGFNPEGKPMAIQLVGRKKEEFLLCQMAHHFTKINKSHLEIPPDFNREDP